MNTEEQQQLRLLEALRARKLVEEDATRLSNRLAQLRKEEERSNKRIEDTRRRAHEILAARRRNEELKQSRDQLNAERQAELDAQREQIVLSAKETQRRKLESIEAFARQKMGKVAETKEEKALLEQMLAEQREIEAQRLVERREAVQAMHKDLRQKTEKTRQKTLQRVRQDYERRLTEEVKYQQSKEKEVQRMARLEMELIQRLQKKQEEQRAAFEELESVLGIQKPAGKPLSPTSHAAQRTAPSAEEAQVAREFGSLDPSGSGTIQATLVGDLLQRLGLSLTPEQVQQATMQLDPKETGTVPYRDFVAWWRG